MSAYVWTLPNEEPDPYDLILAVMFCINVHLRPRPRRADFGRGLHVVARCADEAAKALEALGTVIDRVGRVGWSYRLEAARLSDVTDPRTIADLRHIAAHLDGISARRAFRDTGGRPKMAAFEEFVLELARIFERATGRRAALTHDHYGSSGYGGRFWNFVEIIRPVAASIIETSGAGSLAQPGTEVARGKFIEEVLKKVRTEKTRVAS